ncbi:DUF4435 domain-containing protein [Hymenobacter profundi]|uniref:DUF4435 domain-containing protein n=1 Tax=Hymenobacter profundi TaxID=1982110 RepID=A0ABS6X4Y9_9BACT|nr:DUF4435 domain-containing protein [Hymenobacter profundi]MBW3130899.1 DUF4435 domain-containing protein [Hymenobacter profundi]
MTYLEQLRQARDKSQVTYQEFVLHTRQNKDGLFCFFEGTRGSDNAYYIPRIKVYTKDYYPLLCGGRDKVIEVYNLISLHSEYDKYKKAFFIDRDFNEPLKPEDGHIFETPCYAIENFYVSEHVFKEILKNFFGFSEISNEHKLYLDLYRQRQNEFHQAILLFNAWYACLIEIRNKEGKQTGVRLEEKPPKGFIQFSLESISKNYDINIIKSIFPNATEVTETDLEKKIQYLSQFDKHKVFRGKYEMYFLTAFLELLLKDSTTEKKYSQTKINFTFGDKLSNDQAVALFSAYAETPDILDDYLKSVTA